MYDDFFSAISDQPNFEATHMSQIKNIGLFDIMVLPMGGNQDAESCKVMSLFKGPVILYTPPANNWFKKGLLQRWSNKILFVYNTDESDYSKKRYAEIGIEYLTIPFASNPEKFKPLNVEKIYDVVFVASAESGTGRFRYIDAILKRAKEKNWKVILLGRRWERYGFPFQLVAHGELLNLVYNSAKICINISNDEQKLGQQKCLDLNNRVFDLAMAGCFQISNAPEIVRKYFSEDEVVAVDPEKVFVQKIEDYLSKDKGRKEIAEKARMKALTDHTWQSRATIFVNKTRVCYQKFDTTKNNGGAILFIRKKIDCIVWPKIIGRIVRKIGKILGIKK
jgi:glycosyltransferase involved in cell wall biosynthesis